MLVGAGCFITEQNGSQPADMYIHLLRPVSVVSCHNSRAFGPVIVFQFKGEVLFFFHHTKGRPQGIFYFLSLFL